MKWLFLLAIIAIVVVFLTIRYRRHIQSGIFLLKMFRQMNAAGRKESAPKPIDAATTKSDVELVRCAGCGSWTPRETALKLSKGNFYCQSACIEKAVRV